jgi:radical S-adenosyl methionine domain-containing protein 2
MTSTSEKVINFHMTEACNYRCGYCYSTWEGNDSQAELHHSSQDIQSLLVKLVDYFFSDNPIRRTLGYTSVRINFAGGVAL